MPLEEFRQLFVKLPNSLSHVSFTVGDIAHNPSVLQILSYCVSNDYNPVNVSVTIVDADVTADVARQLTELCHSISVVRHPTNREQCYDAVAALSRFPQRPQTFLSVVFAHETVPFIIACLSDMRRDARLRGNVTALLLQLWRPKGKAALMELHLPTEDDLVQVLQQSRRCSAKIAYDADTGRNVFNFLTLSGATPFLLCQFEGCCSMRFSVYINRRGEAVPCPFLDGLVQWSPDRHNVFTCTDFGAEIWNSAEALAFVQRVEESNPCKSARHCKFFFDW
eukprot:TRINITY_DN1352_c0_g1_i2.p1 TRINITY_DN1352_c0_g1~~TRINITY_DN1352_c0_g1_i2.p1  ORF type:complete len:280 (+),score=77.66 TRINITY_DN1352_c0_g1_i2:564-1403(+)